MSIYPSPHAPCPLQSPGLELQVWSAHSGDVQPGGEDACIGCVAVDLSPLTFGLAQLSGWYNILDFAGQVQGQLKVSGNMTSISSYK